MLIIKASAKPSKISGIGLFADERIPKGTVIWKFDPRFDLLFDPADVKSMPPLQQAFLDRYAYLSPESGKYVYSIDDTRFTNHSAKNNNIDIVAFPDEIETCSVANRDIEIGEELLENYRDFDAHERTSDADYLNT